MAPSDWIAATGIRAVDVDATSTLIPTSVLQDPALSLEAKGIYALLLVKQGAAVDPYDDAFEEDETIASAIEELLAAHLAVRVDLPAS